MRTRIRSAMVAVSAALALGGTTALEQPLQAGAIPLSVLTPAQSGPFVSLIFSRTEVTAAVKCAPNDTGIARLDTEIAPYLQSKGMAATGTLLTGKIKESSRVCTHYGESVMGSWADARKLATQFGWRFGSHTATWPLDPEHMTAQRSYAETCGSAKAIDAHGLPGGHGYIAYPGDQGSPVHLQTAYGSKCFAWARTYNLASTTQWTAGTTSPYWQVTGAPRGGPCNIKTAACYTIHALDSRRYVLPAREISNVAALGRGEWLTMQEFVLVEGVNPPGSRFRWDCRATDPKLHWTTDNERYCLNDWKRVIEAIDARPDITVTAPLAVGVAFGRPGSYPF